MAAISGANIGKALKSLIRERNMTQGDISRATKIKRSYISHIFCGYIGNPRLDTLYKISKSMGMTVSELVSEIENHKNKWGKTK